MKARFLQLAAKYDALAQRERWLVAVAVLGGVLMLGWSLVIDPALMRIRMAERGITEQTAQLSMFRGQLTALQSSARDPEVLARNELEGIKKQLGEVSVRLSAMERELVPPQRMTGLLEEMIGRKNGLRLLSLRTLPVASVVEKKENAEASEAKKLTSGLFKHGVEIKLEGSYAELSDYLARLEKSPQKLLWSSVALSAEKHPKLVLTLTVFTLSLDRAWLIV